MVGQRAGEVAAQGSTATAWRCRPGGVLQLTDSMTSPAAHLSGLIAFVGALVAAFGHHIHQPDAAPGTDPVGYPQVALWLTDESQRLGDERGAEGGPEWRGGRCWSPGDDRGCGNQDC